MFTNIQINCLQNVSWLRKWTTQFTPARISSQCGFDKRCGAKPTELLRDLIALAFIDTPLYLLKGNERPNRSVYYEFLGKGEHNWSKFIYLVATPLIAFLTELTSSKQKKVLIVDDEEIVLAALRADGSVVPWGFGFDNWLTVPGTAQPLLDGTIDVLTVYSSFNYQYECFEWQHQYVRVKLQLLNWRHFSCRDALPTNIFCNHWLLQRPL